MSHRFERLKKKNEKDDAQIVALEDRLAKLESERIGISSRVFRATDTRQYDN